MAKQFDEAEQQEKQNGLQSHANSAGLNLGLDANIVHESLEKRINWTAYKVYWRSAAFNSDDTRMPVATRAQKRKREPEPTEIQGKFGGTQFGIIGYENAGCTNR
ncbi:unnamed protein product, partial [Mesorhabditis belari]|uniref:Uncharacterized protein n=1 Tax=Mesorhabditis belari TaxID=2138241 RepID=A0AAF3EKL3_9BILA